MLGEVDQGWTQLMAGLNVERLILAATMLGIAQRAFDDALAYAKERKQFGRPIGSFQALQHRFADLATDLEAARLMTRWVATLTDEDPDRMLPKEASMVKLFVTEVAKRTTLEGMQMMGGYGYSSEYDMERLVRSSLVSTIYGGTSEIQRSDHRQNSRALGLPSGRGGHFALDQGRLADVEALGVVDVEGAHQGQRLGVLDSLGHRLLAEGLGELDQRLDQSLVGRRSGAVRG